MYSKTKYIIPLLFLNVWLSSKNDVSFIQEVLCDPFQEYNECSMQTINIILVSCRIGENREKKDYELTNLSVNLQLF